MIATILNTSTSFSAVDYNERKVAKGDAQLLCIENLPENNFIGEFNSDSLRRELMEYSARNKRIRNTQLHVAFSCKGEEKDYDELVAIAREWLKEMGYAKEGQPLLIYAHSDTDNNHIHVITSRVDPYGKKINDSHEKRRSQATIDKLMNKDKNIGLDDAIKRVNDYKFEGIGGWIAVMESEGYKVEDNKSDNVFRIIRNGKVMEELNKEEIVKRCSREWKEKKRINQLRAILKKYQQEVSCKEELKESLKQKFGFELCFIGSKDAPRAYFLIDHADKKVYKGSDVVKINQLLKFEDREQKMKNIDAFLDQYFELSGNVSSKDLARKLRKYYHARYKEGKVYWAGEATPLLGYMVDALKRGDKQEWLCSWATKNDRESAILEEVFGVNMPLNHTHGKNNKLQADVDDVRMLVNSVGGDLHLSAEILREQGFLLKKVDNEYYCIGIQRRTIFALTDYGISLHTKVQPRKQNGRVDMPHVRGDNAVASDNREWEIEKGGEEEEYRGMKR